MVTPSLRRMAVLSSAALCLTLMGGCPHDMWAANYKPNPAAVVPRNVGMTDSPQVRLLSPEQVKQAAEIEQKYLDDHKMAREDETLADQKKIHEQQFQVFRVRDNADAVMRLGECAFTHDEPISDNDPGLVRFGQNKGASFILLCLFPQQKSDDYRVNVSHSAWGGGASWGPVGEYSVVAQFFRRLTPEDHQQINGRKP